MDTLEEWITELKGCKKQIIVEGKKDKKILETNGITNIITFSSSPRFFVEKIESKDVVILTDLDAAGKKLYAFLKHELVRRGIRVDTKFREFLFRSTKISHIESIKENIHAN